MIFNLLYVLFTSVWIGGVFLDGWAHRHLPNLETFFTPWHGVLYSGFLMLAILLILTAVKNHRSGLEWRKSVPKGYFPSLVGVVLFMVAGIADMIWHLLFGVEINIEALLSPTHLVLATGGMLISYGLLQASILNLKTKNFLSVLIFSLAVAFLLSVITFMTQYAHPLVSPWSARSGLNEFSNEAAFFPQAVGLSSIVMQTAILMGVILLVIKTVKLPFGSLTLVLAINGLLMTFLQDQYQFMPAVLLTGLIGDVMLNFFSLRLFAFCLPIAFYLLYFLTLFLTDQVWWSVHLWAGSIVVAGITGLLVSFLVFSPLSTKTES